MPAREDTIHVYKRVTLIIWQRLSPTFGIRTINAIAKNSIVRVSKKHSYLSNLRVDQDGLVWEDFDSDIDQVDEDEVGAMMEDFMDEFFDAVATMIGRLVVGKIFAEAEEEIKKGESE